MSIESYIRAKKFDSISSALAHFQSASLELTLIEKAKVSAYFKEKQLLHEPAKQTLVDVLVQKPVTAPVKKKRVSRKKKV